MLAKHLVLAPRLAIARTITSSNRGNLSIYHLTIRRSITMATAHAIHLGPDQTGLWPIKQTDEAAEKVSELLQKDLEVGEILTFGTFVPVLLRYCF
jgi:hypothetical protein